MYRLCITSVAEVAESCKKKLAPGAMAHSALLWLEIPIRITGKWWCDKRIEGLA